MLEVQTFLYKRSIDNALDTNPWSALNADLRGEGGGVGNS